MNPVLAAAFVLGLAGSAHCIGMCGPIALAVPSSSPRWGARLLSTLILNSGRLFTYALLGLAFGAFGTGSRLAGLQQGVSIAAGVVFTQADCSAYNNLPLVGMATKAVLGEDMLLAAGVDYKTYVKFIGARPSAQKVVADRKAASPLV